MTRQENFSISGQLIDCRQRKTYPALITVANGKIASISEIAEAPPQFIAPGFVDAHIHIESSMVVPTEFARVAVTHGTVATISDPHEIANVLGEAGVHFMIENGKQSPFKFFFGAPSCVPATSFESAGAELTSDAVAHLLESEDVFYLSEVMNYPGVIHEDTEMLKKIAAAKKVGKPVDGHAPGVRGDDLRKYVAAGIQTDHECCSIEEAREKLALGMKILIREGSAAKNFAALVPLFFEAPAELMFCSDDKHPDELLTGHINKLAARAVAAGADFYDVLHAASVHPVEHYGVPVGTLKPGDPADFIILDDIESMNVRETYIDGIRVVDDCISQIESVPVVAVNNFNTEPVQPEQIAVAATTGAVRVIVVHDGELVTGSRHEPVWCKAGALLQSVVEKDLLKLVVYNRYSVQPPAVGFVMAVGLERGAIASSVAHDSHNIVAVGVDDNSIAAAINSIVESQGGIAAVDGERVENMPLPVAGLMTTQSVQVTGAHYAALDSMAKEMGSRLRAPFMTLSFLALLVIPELKLSDKGLFDGVAFQFCPLQLAE